MTLFDIVSSADVVCELEPHELAGIAIELLHNAPTGAPSRLHPASFVSPETLGPFGADDRPRVQAAIAEGWQWLVNEGFLAPHPEQTGGWHFLTRRGKLARNKADVDAYRSAVLLPRRMLHPSIAAASWSSFLRGEYDTAVFQAFRELEVSIRVAGDYSDSDYGVDLVRKAFAVAKNSAAAGTLTDVKRTAAEQEALGHLVAGAIGSYKNPHSHRKVALQAEDAVEMIILASHLLKIVDARSPRAG